MIRKCRLCRKEKDETDFDSPDHKTCSNCRAKEQARYLENRGQINAKRREQWRHRSQAQKEANASRSRSYRAQHREEQSAYGRVHYQTHKQDLVKPKRANKLKSKYGITLEEFDALLEEQGGHCAVCDRTCEDGGQHLSVDHDHRTGKVRGILCAKHNQALGLCGDDPNILIALASYLLHNR
jgi:hypothetical protein